MNWGKPCCCMRFACLLSVIFLVAMPAFAEEVSEKEPEKVDVAAVMAREYYERFRKFPSLRKCVPEDAKGKWVETAIFEVATEHETEDQKKNGKKLLAFGEHNTLFWQRSPIALSANDIDVLLKNSRKQYILTDASAFYLYDGGQIQSALLCFVTTKGRKEYPEGLLMLALPVEKAKPLVATLYAPLGK